MQRISPDRDVSEIFTSISVGGFATGIGSSTASAPIWLAIAAGRILVSPPGESYEISFGIIAGMNVLYPWLRQDMYKCQ